MYWILLLRRIYLIKLQDLLYEAFDKKLRVFDFDDTIAKSNSRVKVIHKDGSVTMLKPGEYAVYDKQAGDKFDYTEFKKLIDPKEIKAVTRIIKRMYGADGERRLTILTARGSTAPIKRFMNLIGVYNIEIVGLDDSNPQKKVDWIEDKVKNQGYNNVFFIDDSEKNIRAVSTLKAKYPNVKWKIQLAYY